MPKIHFISPKKSIPTSIAQWLVENLRDKKIPSFFGEALILVPTKSAGKNLRIEILNTLQQCGVQAMSGLKISTLESFFSELITDETCATYSQRIASWIQALTSKTPKFSIFPNGEPNRENLLEIAIELDALKGILSEKPATFAQTKTLLQQSSDIQNPYEQSLWTELSTLEKEYENNLSKMGVKCKYQALQQALSKPIFPYKKIVVAGNADVPANLKTLFENIDSSIEKFVLVPALEHQKNGFDEIGRPLPEFFENEEIDVSEKNTFVFGSVQSQAQAVASVAKAYKNPKGVLAISCEQLKNAYFFKNAFDAVGLKAHIPEADKLSLSMTYKLLKNCIELTDIETFAKFNNTLNNPLILNFICEKFALSVSDFFAIIDDVRENFLPATPQSAIDILNEHTQESNAKILSFAYALIQAINTSPSKAVETISAMLESAKTTAKNFDFDFEEEALSALKNCADELEQTQLYFKFEKKEISELLLKSLENSSSRFPDTENSIPLNNWIEIFWSRKPHLLLCDMNDGIVPLKNSENQFLPDSAMERIGIRNSTLRRARDAYMLKLLQTTRSNATQILLSLKDVGEAPIMPSRILLQTSTLPQRIKFLFREPESKNVELSMPTKIKLHINKHLPENFSMSASKFKSYLDSPLNFYFDYILKAQEVSPEKTEFDALQYGTIFHFVLSKFGESKIKNSLNPAEIYDFLANELDSYIQTEFSANLSAQMQFQIITMKQRFAAVANVQAEHASKGWQIYGKPETRFNFEIDGMKITGSIDRIDYNQITNKYLVIDYKTYNKVERNFTYTRHISKVDADKNIVWKDLQMPIYKMAMQKVFGLDCSCALFASPLDTSETLIDIWDITDEEFESAKQKVSEIISDIRNEKFIPTNAPNNDILPSIMNISRKNILEHLEK